MEISATVGAKGARGNPWTNQPSSTVAPPLLARQSIEKMNILTSIPRACMHDIHQRGSTLAFRICVKGAREVWFSWCWRDHWSHRFPSLRIEMFMMIFFSPFRRVRHAVRSMHCALLSANHFPENSCARAGSILKSKQIVSIPPTRAIDGWLSPDTNGSPPASCSRKGMV